jgi:hypothetical protein
VALVQSILGAYKDHLHDKTILFSSDEDARLEDQRTAKSFQFFTQCGSSRQKRLQLPMSGGGESYLQAGGELLRVMIEMIEIRNYTYAMLLEKQRIYQQTMLDMEARGTMHITDTIAATRCTAQRSLTSNLAKRREHLANTIQVRQEAERQKQALTSKLEQLNQDKVALDARVERARRILIRQRNRMESFRPQRERLRMMQLKQINDITQQIEQERRFVVEGDMNAVNINSWLQEDHVRYTQEKQRVIEAIKHDLSVTRAEVCGSITHARTHARIACWRGCTDVKANV